MAVSWLASETAVRATIEPVTAALADRDGKVRAAARHTLVEWGGDGSAAAIDLLHRIVARGPSSVAAQGALQVLAANPDGHPSTRALLDELLQDPDPAVRAATVTAAAAAGFSAVGATDGDARVRAAWCRAAAQVNDPASAATVLGLLADPEARVRHEAAAALLAYGPVGRALLRHAPDDLATAAMALLQQDLVAEGAR